MERYDNLEYGITYISVNGYSIAVDTYQFDNDIDVRKFAIKELYDIAGYINDDEYKLSVRVDD